MEYRKLVGEMDDIHTELIGLNGIIRTIESESIRRDEAGDLTDAICGAGTLLGYIADRLEKSIDTACDGGVNA